MKIEHARNLVEQDRAEALKRAVRANRRLRSAQAEYEKAILAANDSGVGNTALARAFGVSETSIRLFIKRRRAKGL